MALPRIGSDRAGLRVDPCTASNYPIKIAMMAMTTPGGRFLWKRPVLPTTVPSLNSTESRHEKWI